MQCQSLPCSQELPECGCRALLFVQRLCWRFDRVEHFLELFCSFLFIHYEAVTSLCTWLIMSLDFSIYSTRVLICSCRMLSCSSNLLLSGRVRFCLSFFGGFEVVADVKVFIKFGEDLDFIVGEHGTLRGGGGRRRLRTFLQTKQENLGPPFCCKWNNCLSFCSFRSWYLIDGFVAKNEGWRVEKRLEH